MFQFCRVPSDRPGRFQPVRAKQCQLPHSRDLRGGLGHGGQSRRLYVPLGELFSPVVNLTCATFERGLAPEKFRAPTRLARTSGRHAQKGLRYFCQSNHFEAVDGVTEVCACLGRQALSPHTL